MLITNNEHTIDVNLCQDLLASMLSNFSCVLMDRGLFMWPNCPGETLLSFQEEETVEGNVVI
jgi:hypothetical protein